MGLLDGFTDFLGITNHDAQHNAENLSQQAAGQAQGYRDDAYTQYKGLNQVGANNAQAGQTLLARLMANPQQSQQPLDASSFYNLNNGQQALLNNQRDELSSRQRSAEAELKNAYMKHGITDPGMMAAGLAQIQQSFGALSNTASANASQQAFNNNKDVGQFNQTLQANNLENAWRNMLGLGQMGGSQLGQAGAGVADLGAQAQGLQGQASNQALNYQNSNNTQLGSLLGFGTQLLGNAASNGLIGGTLGGIFGKNNNDTNDTNGDHSDT